MLTAREILQDLISKPYTPFTVLDFKMSLETHLHGVGPDAHADVVYSFLYERFKQLVLSVNFPLLQNVLVELKKSFLSQTDLVDIKLNPNPSQEEVAHFCTRIHQDLQKTQMRKEELLHFTSLFTQAKNYVNSFATSSEILLKEYIGSNKEKRLQRDALLNDLEIYKVHLNSYAKEITHILEEIVSPRMNLLLRLESSLRLLEKYRDPTLRTLTVQI